MDLPAVGAAGEYTSCRLRSADGEQCRVNVRIHRVKPSRAYTRCKRFPPISCVTFSVHARTSNRSSSQVGTCGGQTSCLVWRGRLVSARSSKPLTRRDTREALTMTCGSIWRCILVRVSGRRNGRVPRDPQVRRASMVISYPPHILF